MKLLVTLQVDETGMVVAECPAIPGCVSQGGTEEVAIENIRQAIVGCLEARAANGLPVTIAVREVDRSLTRRLSHTSWAVSRSGSALGRPVSALK